MSSYYLCETCTRNSGDPDRQRICWYKYAHCSIHGDVRMPVMSDDVESAGDLCEDFEAKEADRGR